MAVRLSAGQVVLLPASDQVSWALVVSVRASSRRSGRTAVKSGLKSWTTFLLGGGAEEALVGETVGGAEAEGSEGVAGFGGAGAEVGDDFGDGAGEIR